MKNVDNPMISVVSYTIVSNFTLHCLAKNHSSDLSEDVIRWFVFVTYAVSLLSQVLFALWIEVFYKISNKLVFSPFGFHSQYSNVFNQVLISAFFFEQFIRPGYPCNIVKCLV